MYCNNNIKVVLYGERPGQQQKERKHYISDVNKDEDADVDVWSNKELDRRIRSKIDILEESLTKKRLD